MLSYALTFLVLAIIAAVLGFGGVAGTAAGIAQLFFYGFLILLLVSVLTGLGRGAKPLV
jgi:uncharacterized membrane protein YtjA (UPF0391 family)